MSKTVKTESTAVHFNQEGETYLSQGKLEEAIACYDRAIKLDPNLAKVYQSLGEALKKQGKLEEATVYYQKAIELNATHARNGSEGQQTLAGANGTNGAVKSPQVQPPANPGISTEDPDADTNAIRINPDISWSHNNLAESLVKLERWEEAVNAYRKAIELNPDFSWPHNNLAECLVKLERWEESVNAYRKAIELNPDFSWSHNNLADVLLKLERWDEAIAAYRRSIELNPDHFWAHNNLADCLVKLERWDEAVAAYQRANEINPDFFWSQSKLGDVLLKLERWEDAIAVYRRAAELNRDFAWTYYNMGTAFEKLERWDESIASYRSAAEIQPDLPWLSQKLADALRMGREWDRQDAMGLYRRAIAENPDDVQLYHKALEIAPNDAGLYVELADALVRQNSVDGAIVFYQMALQIRPDDKVISGRLEEVLGKKRVSRAPGGHQNAEDTVDYHKLGETLQGEGKIDEAVVAYRKAIASYSKAGELEPGSAIVHHYLGYTLSILQRWEEAIVCYRKALEMAPGSAAVYQHLGDALARLGRWEEAVGAYRKSVEIEPNSLEAQDHFGLALYQLGQYDQAISAYRKALEIAPNSDVVNCHLGDAMLALQAWDEAISLYHRSIEISPQPPQTYQHLGEALAKKQQWREAALSYQQALQFDPAANYLYRELGEFLIQQNQYEGAVGFFRMSLQPDQKSPDYPWLALSKVIEAYKTTKYSLSKGGYAQITVQEKVSIPNILSSEFNQDSESKTSDVRLIAYYLPQFHPIPENDRWWGKGFTEWTNVTRAQPLFEGHYQPHLPADLGFYDLRLPEVRESQAQLAKKYGIYGFCYYYYWFAGKRLLHLPIDEVVSSKKPDFPFCICWANENWTRRWDGAEHEVLMAQEHSLENNQAFAESIIHILLDDRYIRINGAPLLIIYRSDILPNPLRTTEEWRKVFRQRGVGEVHLSLAITSFSGLVNPIRLGFDSGVQFPPHVMPVKEVPPPPTAVPDFCGQFYDYKCTAINTVIKELPEFKVLPGVMTSWDNTARKKKGAYAFVNSHPDAYEIWLRGAIEKVKQRYSGDERLVFINAWNEWAEGAHLEPDQKYGHAYLSATYKALHGTHSWRTTLELLRHLPDKSIDCIHQLLDELEKRMSAKNRSFQALCKILQESVVVSEITYCYNESDLWWNLESPSRDTVNDTPLTIQGWVLPKTSPAVAVEVLLHGRSIVQTPVDIDRLDVAQVHSLPGADRCGFLAKLEVAKLQSEFDLNIRAILKDGNYFPLAELHLESALNNRQKHEMFHEINGSIEPLLDAVQTIIDVLRLLDEENMNIHQEVLLDQLEKKIEAKEQLIQDIINSLKQIPQHNP